MKMAQENKDFVIGFICRKRLVDDPSFIHLTPGVKLQEGKDSLGQQYLTPSRVIGVNGSDIIIVGRGIYQDSSQIESKCIEYRDAAWKAYQALLSQRD